MSIETQYLRGRNFQENVPNTGASKKGQWNKFPKCKLYDVTRNSE